jgi:NitT/TauT family transport system substrate-binding protein
MIRTLFAALLLASVALPASADTKVKIITPGADKQIYLPAKLAEQLGFYKEEGLDVEIFSSTSGSQAATALLAHEVQGVVGAFDHTIDLQSKGKIITSVVQMLLSPGEVELVSTKNLSYADPKNWKGQALGVTGLGSGTDFLTRYIAGRAGVKPQDITTVPVGAGDTLIAALQQGKIVAGMTTEPTIGRAVQMGAAKIAIDLRTPERTRAALGGDYPFSCLYMEAGWLAQNRELAQKIVNTQVKTLKWIAAHSANEIADKMPKDYFGGSRELYVEGLKEAKAMYSPDGKMPEGGPESVLKILSAYSPTLQGKTIDLSKTFTNELVTRAAASN